MSESLPRPQRRSTPLPGPAVSARRETVRVTLPVYGLSCGGGGALTAERALIRLAGVLRAYVNPATEMAYVEYDPAVCDVAALQNTLQSRGFRAGDPVPP
ncbi:MAG: heavy-metal-associated domain-containing protein [Chloroflexota bacterium]|nr:heavy-metal-associated domain-containing protein [Chloroflexota bacterium]